jgi:predicted nucleotide-binding protein
LGPDDVGCLEEERDTPTAWEPRSRQNVIFELGFFIGLLGRARVCALKFGEVRVPSDYDGVVYVPFDEGGAWRYALGREINASGIDVDLNRI